MVWTSSGRVREAPPSALGRAGGGQELIQRLESSGAARPGAGRVRQVAERGAKLDVAAIWAALEQVGPRAGFSTAVATVLALVPEDDGSAEAAMREGFPRWAAPTSTSWDATRSRPPSRSRGCVRCATRTPPRTTRRTRRPPAGPTELVGSPGGVPMAWAVREAPRSADAADCTGAYTVPAFDLGAFSSRR